MRMMVRVTIEVGAGNKAIREGTMQELMPKLMGQLKPEAAYFTADHGHRTAYLFLDMKDSSQMPPMLEPFFQALNATVEVMPVMNADDLNKGLAEYAKQGGGR